MRKRKLEKPSEASPGADRHRRSMGARPAQAPRVRATQREDGGLLVTVLLQRPRWQRMLGGQGTMERSFGLDAVGRQVYDWCDGRASVADLIRRFARERQVHPAEAEAAVTTFLRTLVTKGLIVMEIAKPAAK
jgi:hypothetical protein